MGENAEMLIDFKPAVYLNGKLNSFLTKNTQNINLFQRLLRLGKGKFAPVNSMKVCGGSRGIALVIFNLCSRWL
jgi:hypothetical protein